MNKPDLGGLLMSKGWITRTELNRALAIQRQVPGRLGSCLLEIDAISEDQLLAALSEQLGVPSVPAETLRSIPQKAIDLVPAKLALRGPVIPFRISGNRLHVALEETTNLSLQDEIAFASGKRLEIHVACEARIYEALERYYGEVAPVRFARLIDRLNRSRYLWNGDAAKRRRQERREQTMAPLGPPLPAPRPPAATAKPEHQPEARSQPPPRAEPSSGPPAEPELTLATIEPAVAEGQTTDSEPAAREAALDKAAVAAELFDDSGSHELPPHAATPTIRLTPEERAALEESERRRTATAVEGTLRERLHLAGDREQLGEILLDSLATHFERVALLIAESERVRGWKIAGKGARPGSIRGLEIDLDQPSALVNLHLGSEFAVGPLADLPAHRELLGCWRRDEGESESGAQCWLVAVRLKDRMVTVLYAEGQRSEVDAIGGLRALRWFADEASKAFESFILRKKQRLAKPSDRV